MVQMYTINGMEMGAQDWRDTLSLKYVLEPQDLPKLCDGCNAEFSIFHVLNFNKGGLVTARQNELHDGVADLSGKTFYAHAHV